MSASIDQRIVEMKFDNTQFEAGVRQTLSSLQALEKGMKLDGAAKGLASAGKSMDALSNAGKRFSLAPVTNAVESVKASFSAMTVIGAAALGSLAAQATQYGVKIARGIFGPIKDGLGEYETNLNSIQTILANTQAAGVKLPQVNAALKELNKYSDDTIYNFSEMARNIGTFTAAGVDLNTATGAIKGIANVAALSGSNSEQAARAMYQLSQAIANGRVTAMDWNSVTTAGMGGTVLQRALTNTAIAMGTLNKETVKLKGPMKNVSIAGKSFRESIMAEPGKESWLTGDVLTATFKQFTGDMKDAELAAMGFSAAQIKAIQLQAATAKAAATEVKTGTALIGVLKEAVGTGWADTWTIVLGDFEEAKKMWTGAYNELSKLINKGSDARNKLLGEWKKNGGRDAMIDSVKNGFKALLLVVAPIKAAFREIFPPTTGKQLAEMTKNVAEFLKGLQIGSETADRLKRTFAGVFAIFDIGWQVIKNVARIFRDLFTEANSGDKSFLDVTARIGDFLVALDNAVKKGDGLKKFFNGLRDVLVKPLHALMAIRDAILGMFDGFDGAGALPKIQAKFAPLGSLAKMISTAWSFLFDKLGDVAGLGAKLPGMFSGLFKGIGDAFSGMFKDGFNFDNFITLFQNGMLVVLVKVIFDFIKKLHEVADEAQGTMSAFKGAIETITGPFEALTGTLEAMQNTLRAMTILQIAAAVALLAYSMVQISKVDEKGLKRALKAMTVLFIELTAAMAIFQKIQIGKGFASLILLALAINILADAVIKLGGIDFVDLMKGLLGVHALLMAIVVAAKLMPDGKKMINSSLGLILMATAIRILAQAVLTLGSMSWEDMARGLTGVGAMLTALALFTRFASTNAGGIAQGVGIILLATGIKILAGALKDIASMSWEELGRGLAGMGGGLALIGAALKLIPPSSILSAAAVAVVAMALGMIGDAVQQMAGMQWDEIARGMTVMGGALGMIALALSLMPPTSILSAAAIFVTAVSLGMLAKALQQMGSMGWEEIAKGLVMLGGALTIIAVAVTLMALALPGAVALTVIVAALTIFLPILALMGQMSWEEIGKGMVVLAGAFLILGVAGALLTPVIPTLLGLGIAIALLGVGMAAAGLGLLAFATGLTALAAAGTAGVAAIVAIVAGLIGLIPTVMTQIGLGVVAFARTIAAAAPAIMQSMTVVILALLNTIRRLTPSVISTLLVMLAGLLRALVVAVPMMVNAGMKLIIGILDGIARNIGKLIQKGTDVIVNFLKGISAAVPRLADQAAKTVIAFVNGVADAIRANSGELGKAGANMATAIVEGMVKGIAGGIGQVTSEAKRLASSALSAAKNALGIHSPSREFAKLGAFSAQGYAKGLDGGRKEITASAASLRSLINDAMKNAAGDIKSLTAKLDKLRHARHKDNKAIKETSKALAQARAEYAKASKASKIAYSFGDENKKLLTLADKQAKIATQLDDANKKLADAIKTRDDYNKQVSDQFSNLPDIGEDEKLSDYVDALKKQVVDTQIFTAQLQQLRKMGLNDAMYKELLSKGTSAIPFLEQMLGAGQNGIDELNTLGSALDKSAKDLGNSASKALYQAAVDSAAGLVKGLQNQQAAIEKEMDKIAAGMVKAIKKALGIKSPSREFMKIGDWSTQGLAKGLESSTAAVTAAETVGHNAIDAMRKTLTGLSDIVGDEVDINPTIKPVLDLTDVRKGAGQISGMMPTRTLEVSGAYSQASSASVALKERGLDEANASRGSGDTWVFNQNNYSPKAISPVETYRNTRNQLSTAKGARKRR